MKRRLFILPILAGFVLSGCSFQDLMFWKKKSDDTQQKEEKNDQDQQQEEQNSVVSVSISGSKSELILGETLKLSANVQVTGSAAKTVSWSSNAEAVATVSSTGLVTTKSTGSVTITAKSTVDESKTASVTITVKQPTWSADVIDMFEDTLGEAVPAFYLSSAFTWTDEYYDTYYCMCAEASGNKVSEVAAAMDLIPAYEGMSDGEGGYIYYADTTVMTDYDFYIEVYYYDGATSIDVYLEPAQYDAWPSEVIAAHLTKLGFTTAVLPAFETTEEFVFTCIYAVDNDDNDIVYITAIGGYDSDVSALDYVNLFDDTKYIASYDTEGGYYQLKAKDLSHAVIVYDQYQAYEYDSELGGYVYAGGFEVIVMPYTANYSLEVENNFEMIEVGGSLDLTVLCGDDVPLDAEFTFVSDKPAVATVNDEGHVIGAGAGTATITISYEDKASTTATVYVVDALPSAFSAADLAEFEKIHNVEGIVVPFSKYFESVEYDEQDKVLFALGKDINYEKLDEYYDAMIAAGWTDLYAGSYQGFVDAEMADTLEEAKELVYSMAFGFFFEKEFNTSEGKFVVSSNVYLQTEDEEGEPTVGFEGMLVVSVYDLNFYDYDEAVAELNDYLVGGGLESVPTFPDSLPADRYSVDYDYDDDAYSFIAYGASLSLADLKTGLESVDFVLQTVHVEATQDEEAYDYLDGTSSDGKLLVQAAVFDDVVMMQFKIKRPGAFFDFATLDSTSGSKDGFAFATAVGTNESNQASQYNADSKELRLYIGNTMTISSESDPITSIFISANTCTHPKADGTLTASTGTLNTVEGGYEWTGNAESVTFTVISGKQVHINSISINGVTA